MQTLYLILQLFEIGLKHTDNNQVLVYSVAMIIISTYCIIKNEGLAFTEGDLRVYTSKAIGSTIKRLSKKERKQVD